MSCPTNLETESVNRQPAISSVVVGETFRRAEEIYFSWCGEKGSTDCAAARIDLFAMLLGRLSSALGGVLDADTYKVVRSMSLRLEHEATAFYDEVKKWWVQGSYH